MWCRACSFTLHNTGTIFFFVPWSLTFIMFCLVHLSLQSLRYHGQCIHKLGLWVKGSLWLICRISTGQGYFSIILVQFKLDFRVHAFKHRGIAFKHKGIHLRTPRATTSGRSGARSDDTRRITKTYLTDTLKLNGGRAVSASHQIIVVDRCRRSHEMWGDIPCPCAARASSTAYLE